MVIQIKIIKGELDDSQQTIINTACLELRNRFIKEIKFPDSETYGDCLLDE